MAAESEKASDTMAADVRAADWLPIVLLTLLAIATRWFALGEGDVVDDELFTAQRSTAEGWLRLNPLQHLLVYLSFEAFGRSTWALRLPSFLLGAVSIPLLAVVWRRWVGRSASGFAALLAVLSSWHLWHSQISRYYAGVFLFGTLAYVFYYAAVRRGSVGQLVLSLAMAVVATQFHATAALLLLPCFLFSCLLWTPLGAGAAGFSRRLARLHVTALVTLGVLSLPAAWWLARLWKGQFESWGFDSFGLLLQIVKYVQPPVAVAAVIGCALLWRRDRWLAIFLGLGTAVPVLFAMVASLVINFRPDYLYQSAPLAFVLAGVACAAVRDAFDRRPAGFVLVAVLATAMVPEFVSHYTARRSLSLQEAVDVIDRRHRDGDRVLSFPGGFRDFTRHPERYPEDDPDRPALLPFVSDEFDHRIDWASVLDPQLEMPGRLRILVRVRRAPLAPDLERWLFENASLVWRRLAERYDYTVEGYAIYETDPPAVVALPPPSSGDVVDAVPAAPAVEHQ